MKKEVSLPVAIVLIVICLIVVSFLGYRGIQGPTPPPVKAPMGAPVVPPTGGHPTLPAPTGSNVR